MTTTATKDNARLPIIAVPHHYDLFYRNVDLENHVFDGTVSIELTAVPGAKGRSIVLHALKLQILTANLRLKQNGSDVLDSNSDLLPAVYQADEFRYVSNSDLLPAAVVYQADEFRYVLKAQTCEIMFGEEFVWKEGAQYVLELEFHGILNDTMRGLYRSTYIGLDGKSHTMATTQFEPTDARQAFPCFDEPALKATFSLSVSLPVHLQTISNTPPASIHTAHHKDGSAVKTITFQKTPKMSTYLLALVVGEFDCISKTSSQIVTTVYTSPGKAELGRFCLDTAVQCLDLLQQLFEIPYPLTKSDLVAIPDFAAGAMENWALCTYREAKILVKPDSTSESTKRGIARTVCHELAHQWFGNLVTMEFWTQLWLKEGVARFMEFVAIDRIFPEWNAWTEFVQGVYGLAQSLDSMKTSHPVEVEVGHPDEINEIFDAISYAKGASIIRMVSSYIGFQTFLDGMKLYLSRYAYANATTVDLWQALEETSGKPIAELMSPWTSQIGFPILMLPEASSDEPIRTPRFLASGPDSGEEASTSSWPIPVTAQVQGLDETQGPWVINGPTEDESGLLRDKMKEWSSAGKWFKLNIGQCGFYRVAYTKEQWKKLSNVMDPAGPLSPTDRLGLISDSFAAGRAGYSSIVESLNLIKSFGDHENAGKQMVLFD
jgi:puromycin-sensitive aminopeptidase